MQQLYTSAFMVTRFTTIFLAYFAKYGSFKYQYCYHNTSCWYRSIYHRGNKYFRAYFTSWYFLIQLTSQSIQHFLAFLSREAIAGCVSEEVHIVHPHKMLLSDFVRLKTLPPTVSFVSIPVLGPSRRAYRSAHISLLLKTNGQLIRMT